MGVTHSSMTGLGVGMTVQEQARAWMGNEKKPPNFHGNVCCFYYAGELIWIMLGTVSLMPLDSHIPREMSYLFIPIY